jgi:hypothetical protein
VPRAFALGADGPRWRFGAQLIQQVLDLRRVRAFSQHRSDRLSVWHGRPLADPSVPAHFTFLIMLVRNASPRARRSATRRITFRNGSTSGRAEGHNQSAGTKPAKHCLSRDAVDADENVTAVAICVGEYFPEASASSDPTRATKRRVDRFLPRPSFGGGDVPRNFYGFELGYAS